jgi:inosine-uridine nucleoside N-ribohydrolase
VTDALARAVRKRKLTYIALGPLTNLAAFLSLHPKLATNIERVIIVGGQSPGHPPAFGPARSHRIHDANVFKDPTSAAAVLKSGIPVTLAAIDVARQLALTRDDLEQLRGSGPAGDFLFKKTRTWLWFWTRYVGESGGLIFDALAVLPAIRSDLVQVERRFAAVDRGGNMVAYRERRAHAQPVQFSTRVSRAAKPLLIRRLSGRAKSDGVARR